MTDSAHLQLPAAFATLGLEQSLLLALAEIHFTEPSEIQQKLIPVALTGADCLGQARTGTGKTAAFGLPIMQRLDVHQPFQAIVVVPTRELAVQVEAELIRFAKHKPIRLQVIYGGQKVSHDIKLLERHPHVVVGTPGRIIDLYERGVLPLDRMRFVVCDEVDRMFDIGFRDDVRKILGACSGPHQTIFVSATINDEIERLVAKHMTNPQRIFTAKAEDTLTNPEATQYMVGVQPWDKLRALQMLIRHENPKLAIIFCRTKRSVDKVAHSLQLRGVNASPIHGDLLQNKRERVMRGFRTGKISVLVATDLASRGIDVHEITHVINYDIPEDPEVYVHRVGRTARMGATGKAFTFVSVGQAQLQTEIEKLINHLFEDFRIPGFIPSPEPSKRHLEAQGTGATDGATTSAEGTSAGQSGTDHPSPAPPITEGYAPVSFTQPAAAAKPRPISGRFPTRRRR
ncbi:MAG: DEAD/DEAH box helicase [Phycisphaerales bacterium]|nr:DEAD/DEAH box helicase [Phycisphaerales bacterium]